MSLVASNSNSLLSSLTGNGAQANNSKWALVLEDGSRVNFTSILNIDVNSENDVISSPTEDAFASYNKVIGPTTIDLVCSYQGDDTQRQAITSKLMALSGDMSLLTLVTPEAIYKNYNLMGVHYSRKADDGMDIIYYDLNLIEIREVAQQYTNVARPKKKQTGQKAPEQSALDAAISSLF